MIRRLLTIAAIGTGLALYDAAARWRDLHLAACRRIVELERLLRFERRAVDTLAEQVGRETELAQAAWQVAGDAMRSSMRLHDRVYELEAELAAFRAPAEVSDKRHLAEMAVDGVSVEMEDGNG